MQYDFQFQRTRRLKMNANVRRLVAENSLSTADLIWPIFIRDQDDEAEISSMPGIKRYSIDELEEVIQTVTDLQIPCVALFQKTPDGQRTPDGEGATDPENYVCRAIRRLKELMPELCVMADVALDPFTSHCHDGVIRDGQVDNDASVLVLVEQARVQAEAGVDIIAPSDMMDGRVAVIREMLETAGHKNVMIMSYAAKYASSFYGPFRAAVGYTGLQGPKDKLTYQVSPTQMNEALRKVAVDIDEGADMIIVKPGLMYLDVLHAAAQSFNVPLFSYHVSGEYSMLKAAAERGWIDERKCVLESLMAFKRGGASGILTYYAPQAARWLLEG